MLARISSVSTATSASLWFRARFFTALWVLKRGSKAVSTGPTSATTFWLAPACTR